MLAGAAERFWKWVGQSLKKSMISGDKQKKEKKKVMPKVGGPGPHSKKKKKKVGGPLAHMAYTVPPPLNVSVWLQYLIKHIEKNNAIRDTIKVFLIWNASTCFF